VWNENGFSLGKNRICKKPHYEYNEVGKTVQLEFLGALLGFWGFVVDYQEIIVRPQQGEHGCKCFIDSFMLEGGETMIWVRNGT